MYASSESSESEVEAEGNVAAGTLFSSFLLQFCASYAITVFMKVFSVYHYCIQLYTSHSNSHSSKLFLLNAFTVLQEVCKCIAAVSLAIVKLKMKGTGLLAT